MSEKLPRSRSKAEDRATIQASHETLRHDGDHWVLAGPNNLRQRIKAPGLVPAVENAIAILEALNILAPQPASLAELATSLNISRSHCHSILKTLVSYGWISFDERAKDYRLDIGVMASISSVFRSGTLDVIRQVSNELAGRVQVPVTLTKHQPDGGYVLIDKFNVYGVMEVSFPIGHCYPEDAVGQMRAMLAWQKPDFIDKWLKNWHPRKYTKHTLINKAKVREKIDETRVRGYSVSDEEFTEGTFVLSAPIFDREGNVSFLLTCTSMKEVMSSREKAVGKELVSALAQIHARTGAHPPIEFARILAAASPW